MTAAWQSRWRQGAWLALVAALGAGCSEPGAQTCRQVVALGAAAREVGVLRADGSLWRWEGNLPPKRIEGTFAPAFASPSAFCVLRPPGVWCPLINLSLPATTVSASILADTWTNESARVCSVLGDGALTCRAAGETSVVQADPVGIVTVGIRMLCATNAAGAVFCRNLDNQALHLGDWDLPAGSFPALDGVAEMVPTQYGFCGRKPDGSVLCWGESFQDGRGGFNVEVTDTERIVGLGGPVKALAASRSRVCALREDGAVLCWSTNEPYEEVVPGSRLAGVPQEITGLPMAATAIVTQDRYACALLVDQTVWCWGGQSFGGGPLAPHGPEPLTGCGP